MEYSIPAIRRLQLGKLLRELRKQAGLSIHQAGPDLDMSPSTLNRIEDGQGRTHPLVVRGALDLYEGPFEVVEEVMALAREAHRTTWWVLQGIGANSYAALESEAAMVRNFELTAFPGILQTEAYASAWFTHDSTRDRNRNLAVRMNRVNRLTGDNALVLHVIIDETALIRPVGGAKVMRHQLRHLADLSELTNITIQVLPLALGANHGLRGAFSVLTFPPDTIDDLAYIDHAAGNLQISKAATVKELRARFGSLAKLALNPNESLALIARIRP